MMMKRIRLSLLVLGATFVFAGLTLAADQSCCQKAIAAGKTCSHPCCVAAQKDGKVCGSCNKDLKACCEEALKAGKPCEKCNPKSE